MRVVKYYSNRDLRLEELPVPQIEEGEILVEVLASGICGTDAMQWYRARKGPRILGHEIAGVISESKSQKYKKGDRVFVSHHVPCNRCKYCLAGNHTACDTLHNGNYYPGGFSEFIRVPKINVDFGVYLLPDNVSYEEAAMIEPLACAVRAQRVIGISKEHTVLILGSGVSGLLNITLAKLKGAKVAAADINGYRIRKAEEFGADRAIDAAEGLDIKADRVIVCTGARPAADQAFKCIDKAGIILFFAIPDKDITIPTLDFWRNEITVTSSYGAAPVDLKESLDMIAGAEVDVKALITHRLPLEEAGRGFELVSKAEESLKVILEPKEKRVQEERL